VVAHVCGDWVRDQYFWFREIQEHICGRQRSGLVRPTGRNLSDGTKGTALWNAFPRGGAPWNLSDQAAQVHERVESGLISYGGDTDGQPL
jgi:aminomethyltransferase